MKRHIARSILAPLKAVEAQGLCAVPLRYKYRYCPRCRREWPAIQKSCPECVHWLGEEPLERTEWQLAPTNTGRSAPQGYELVGASVLVLRVTGGPIPTEQQMSKVAALIEETVTVPNATSCQVAGKGWLVWTVEGLRRAFLQGVEVEQRLVRSLPRLEGILMHGVKVRWGVWTDQYVLPFDCQGGLAIGDVSAQAIFDFEPDNTLFSSEPIYQANRGWTHFVCVRRRLLDGKDDYGYRIIGHKRPSALDRAEAAHANQFVGRERQISIVESCWKRVGRTTKLSILAEAGSGKTRLIKEWLRRHRELRAITANFSLFGGGVEDFAGQLAELPADSLDCDKLVDAVAARIRRDKIEVLVLDDLHWADAAGQAFVRRLLAALPASGVLVILSSRPSGQALLKVLHPAFELRLKPLTSSAAEELAEGLTGSKAVAAAAAHRSKGNPLFVEQFVAWAAETNFQGGHSGLRNLHQVIAARIEYLSNVRMAEIQQRLRWGRSWERQIVNDELGRMEVEIGLWLDRLETGDYADRVEAARHLVHLERLDYEIFITGTLAGRPRTRSSRLQEAIERLLIGSADQILADLKRRATRDSDTTNADVSSDAQRAGDVLVEAYNWRAARAFYELASSGASTWLDPNIARQIAQCRDHMQKSITDDGEIYAVSEGREIDRRPNVGALDLPYVWAELGRVHSCGKYFTRAAEAAEAINDPALATWAKRKATELGRATRRRHCRQA